jgi:hypothetical protein
VCLDIMAKKVVYNDNDGKVKLSTISLDIQA